MRVRRVDRQSQCEGMRLRTSHRAERASAVDSVPRTVASCFYPLNINALQINSTSVLSLYRILRYFLQILLFLHPLAPLGDRSVKELRPHSSSEGMRLHKEMYHWQSLVSRIEG